jgi:hypothetical protein
MKSKFLIIFLLSFSIVQIFPDGFSEEEQEIINLLYETQYDFIQYHRRINFIKKVNMGIPGGDNYVTTWGDSPYIIVYMINKTTSTIKEYFFYSFLSLMKYPNLIL